MEIVKQGDDVFERVCRADTKFNAPFGPKDGVLHLLNLHAVPRGLHHLMIEICNDLLESEGQQQDWAQRLLEPFRFR